MYCYVNMCSVLSARVWPRNSAEAQDLYSDLIDIHF